MGFDGEIITTAEKELIVQPNSSNNYWKIKTEDFINAKPSESFINIKLLSEDSIVSSKNYFFVKPNEMELIEPKITWLTKKENEHYKIILSTNVLAKNIFIDVDLEGLLSDNYFDIIPGEKKEIVFYPKTDSDMPLNLKIISLWDVIKNKFN